MCLGKWKKRRIKMEKVNFEEDVAFAISEEVRKKNYQIVLKNFPVKSFNAIEQEQGKDKNDFDCELKDGTKIKIEFKNRRKKAIAYDMALEVHNNFSNKSFGCIFNLIENDVNYLIYTWHGKKKECYIILKAKELEKWWRENYTKYKLRLNKKSYKDDNVWQSSYCFVPIKDFPKEIIFKHETFIDLDDFWGGKN